MQDYHSLKSRRVDSHLLEFGFGRAEREAHMSMVISDTPRSILPTESLANLFARIPFAVRAVATICALAIGGYQLHLALQSPAEQIRGELQAAAAETHSLPWSRSLDQVQSA